MKSPMNTEIDYPISIYLFNSQSDKPYSDHNYLNLILKKETFFAIRKNVTEYLPL